MNGGAMNNYYFSGSLASVDNKFVDFEDSGIPVDIYNNEYENPKVNIESASRSIMLNSENILDSSYNSDIPSCDGLYSSQYYCDEPKIDSKTYEYEGCQKNNTVLVNCYVREGVECSGSKTFYQFKSCYYTNGYHFSVALGLSVFLGICGIDRMYLGYVGYGLFKLFTIGGFGFLWVYDILLISLQIVIPRDGSNYIVGSDGPRSIHFLRNNNTYNAF
ncbi:hypothetical protein ABK040_002609 [Willaertia magna]